MALVRCDECGADVSEQAVSCPRCGGRIRRTRSTERLIVRLLVAGLIIVAVVFWVWLES